MERMPENKYPYFRSFEYKKRIFRLVMTQQKNMKEVAL